MAIYHLSVKTVSRSAGRSATAAAAYRAGCQITDVRTGQIHDYTRKGGIVATALIVPASAPEWAADRAQLWNAAELAETRKNSTVAREFEIALPAELTPAEREQLARDFAQEIVDRHGVAADVAIHAPGRGGDNRNHHAHILLTTRRLAPDGFGEKSRELDDQKTGKALVVEWRERFATLQNERLRDAGHAVTVDHRSHADRGLDVEPTRHLGPAATGYERRTEQPSRKRQWHQEDALAALAAAKAAGELERQSRETEQQIIDLSGDLAAAKRERVELERAERIEAARVERERERGREMLERAEQQLADRERIERMTSRELAAEIERRRAALPRVDDLVNADPDVRLARAALERIERERERGREMLERAERDAQQWRERHKIGAWLHDRGFESETLKELEQQRQRAKAAGRAAAREFDDAFSADRSARIAAREYIEIQQMWPQLEIEKLQSLRAEKLQQERLEAERQRKESRAEKRRDKGLDDDGPGWSR